MIPNSGEVDTQPAAGDRPLFDDPEAQRLAWQFKQQLEAGKPIPQLIREVLMSAEWPTEIFKKTSAQFGLEFDCKAGCHWCCSQFVTAGLLESLGLGLYLLHDVPKKQRHKIKKRLAKHALGFQRARDKYEYVNCGALCCFLVDQRCAVYAARPIPCRVYYSTDVNVCQRFHEIRAGQAEDDGQASTAIARDQPTVISTLSALMVLHGLLADHGSLPPLTHFYEMQVIAYQVLRYRMGLFERLNGGDFSLLEPARLPPEAMAQGYRDEQASRERSKAYKDKNAEFEKLYRINLLKTMKR